MKGLHVLKALIQRVAEASVKVEENHVGRIGPGILILLGINKSDELKDCEWLTNKIANLRIFPGDKTNFDQSALDIQAPILLVSQFTLCAKTRKGRRPDFTDAASPTEAKMYYSHFKKLLEGYGLTVETGIFQQYMQVYLVNDGPVTVMLDSMDRQLPRRV